jgi:hypothetical protein
MFVIAVLPVRPGAPDVCARAEREAISVRRAPAI